MNTSKIIGSLPWGAQSRLAEQFDVSRQAVNKALSGEMKGPAAERILNAAKILVELRQHQIQAARLRARIAKMSDDDLLKWAKPLLKSLAH